MGRPRAKQTLAARMVASERHRSQPPAPPATPTEPLGPMPRLLDIAGPEIAATPFGQVTSIKARHKLVRDGKLAGVRIGRRTFVTEQALLDFLRGIAARR